MQPSNVFVVTNFRFASKARRVSPPPCLVGNPHLCLLGRVQVDSVSVSKKSLKIFVCGEISDIQVFSKHNKNLILLCVFIIVFIILFSFLFVRSINGARSTNTYKTIAAQRRTQIHTYTHTHIFILQHKTGERLRIKL